MSPSETAAEFLRSFQAMLDSRANQIIDMGLRIRTLEAERDQALADARVLAEWIQRRRTWADQVWTGSTEETAALERNKP